MLRFAYIVSMPGLDPVSFAGTYVNRASMNRIVGVDLEAAGFEQTQEVVESLVGEGYTLFNFCSGFEEADLDRLRDAIGGDVRMACASYFPEEEKKLGDFSHYGIIVQMAGVEDNTGIPVHGDAFETSAIFVKDMAGARTAAKQLVKDGATFIELCSWFDADRTREIIAAIDGRVPVGSCGIR
ncbi:MAG: DUF6506 family protein [Anaerovoracaceae bacterium]|jgi:hypothetical protein